MNGGSLKQLVDFIGPLPEDILLIIGKQIVDAVSQLNPENILHLELNPNLISLNS